MKTTITTKRGASVEITFNPEKRREFGISVAGHNFNAYRILLVGNIAKFRDGKQPVEIPMDEKNVEIFQSFLNDIKEAKRAKKEAEYAHLKDQLRPVSDVVISKEGDDKKVQKLLEQAKRQPVFSGSDSEGLNIASEAGAARLRKEATKYCSHEIKVSYDYGYTSYGTKKLTREIECHKCGMMLRESKEDISESAIWR